MQRRANWLPMPSFPSQKLPWQKLPWQKLPWQKLPWQPRYLPKFKNKRQQPNLIEYETVAQGVLPKWL
ncbi:hypothetical protein F7725_029008 [Dissostichus mawsoni]|uniref:Uncharacterized protein n=1 Tax=Dissostichus mawsoni TaxID=36200 RepID=A0A7J5XHL5_DISMA|nr:hypothetical protein F7725_029008 [Dissostichus mawsoni]